MAPPAAEAAAPGPAAAAPRSRRRAALVSLVGGSANVVLLIVQGLLLVPLYLRYIGPTTYGAWMASGDVLGWLSVLDLGVSGIVLQRMAAAHGRGDHRSVAEYYGTGILVQSSLVALLTLIAVGAASRVPGWLHVQGAEAAELSACFAVAGLATGLGLLGYVVGGLALATQRMLFVNVATFVTGLAGIAVTLVLLLAGHGLWALALGMLARTGLLLLATAVHAAWVVRHDLRVRLAPRRTVLRELAGLSSVSVLTMLGNAAAGRSDALLIGLLFGPQSVTVYVLTRRAGEIVAQFLARIGGAVSPGFAHLVGSGDDARATAVLGQVQRAYLVAGSASVALYIALNRTFMELWVGRAQYGGHALTVLMGINVLVVGWSALVLYLDGAAGIIRRAGVLVFVEAVVRICAALVLLRVWGVGALPVAGVVTTALAGELGLHWLRRRLGGGARPRLGMRLRGAVLPALLLGLGIAAGTVRWAGSWPGFVLAGAVLSAAAAVLVAGLEPAARARIGALIRGRGARGEAAA